MRKLTLLSTLAGTAIFVAMPVAAQEITPLTDYDATQIEGAWSVDNMLAADVYGEDGDLVGHVKNVILSSDNNVTHVVIETDNWFDLGDRAIAVPWDNIDLTPGTEGISAPLDEDEMNDFSLFADDQTNATDGSNFRASDVLDDYVSLQDGTEYGYISDLLFTQDGTLSSVLVTPDVGFGGADYTGGIYAYPYYGADYGYDPLTNGYSLPYTQDDVMNYGPYDTSTLGDGI